MPFYHLETRQTILSYAFGLPTTTVRIDPESHIYHNISACVSMCEHVYRWPIFVSAQLLTRRTTKAPMVICRKFPICHFLLFVCTYHLIFCFRIDCIQHSATVELMKPLVDFYVMTKCQHTKQNKKNCVRQEHFRKQIIGLPFLLSRCS